jgi:hypothetical protein
MRAGWSAPVFVTAVGCLLLSSPDRCFAVSADSDLAEAAADAYLFGYPLVIVDVTRQTQAAAATATGRKALANHLTHTRAFPDHTFTQVVRPNVDTLFTSAWIDLKRGPVVLSVPDTGKRYYLMQLMDAWTNVFGSPGTRTTGNGKGDFGIVGPGWTGKLPDGVSEIRSPTNMVWLLGRIQTNGKTDYEAVHAVQNGFGMAPLSAWGKRDAPAEDIVIEPGAAARTPPNDQLARMDAATFFSRLNNLMKDNPPAAADAPALKRFAAIGVGPGKAFDLKGMDPAVAEVIERGVRLARERLAGAARKARGKDVNGWDIATNLGRYGTDYGLRAVVALVGLGANLPEDALYPRARVDADGQTLTGAKRYTLRFPKGQLPPARAFWSVTMYNTRNFLVENPIGRYTLGDRDPLKFDENGSLTLYIQHDSPGKDHEANWLPAPSAEFDLSLRLYWPKQQAANGTWKPPPVVRVNDK